MSVSLDEQKRLACLEVDSLDEKMRTLAVFIADHPELGFQEYKALQVLSEFLDRQGLETEVGIAQMPTAFRAQMVKDQGPTIALFVEFDALPEIGHGCGHNISGVAAVAAGIAVSRHMSRGTIRLLGSPAEEEMSPMPAERSD